MIRSPALTIQPPPMAPAHPSMPKPPTAPPVPLMSLQTSPVLPILPPPPAVGISLPTSLAVGTTTSSPGKFF